MSYFEFLKDKIPQIILLLFAMLTIEMFLLVYSNGIFIKLYVPVILLITLSISSFIEYFRKKGFYSRIQDTLNDLEEKFYISELIEEPNFIEGRLLKEILLQTNKSMVDNVNKYKYIQEDYKEYIEMWIHEIKIPIATTKLIIENNKSKVTKSIEEEIEKIENYTEQALYYARSSTVEKDYIIRKCSLKDIVQECIRKNKTILIQEKIVVDTHDIDIQVNTDSKWIIFILNQIIQNSIKYRKIGEFSQIEIYSSRGKENVILSIKDNGMGIEKAEVDRVFEKGFTGTNGRILDKKSTGIGLYLCKKLCDKLGIAIELNSVKNEGTQVNLIFPNGSYTSMN